MVNTSSDTTFADDLASLILSLTLGITVAGMFVGVEPTTKVDPCVVVYSEPGPLGMQTMDSPRPAIEHPRARVTVRAVAYDQAQKRAQDLYDALWAYGSVLNGHRYGNIWPMGHPYLMGEPDVQNRRPVGFLVMARRIT